MDKWRRFLLAGALVLITVPLVLVLVTNPFLRDNLELFCQRIPYCPKQAITKLGDVQFSFVSELPGYTIDQKSVDTVLLTLALNKLGLLPLVNKPLVALKPVPLPS